MCRNVFRKGAKSFPVAARQADGSPVTDASICCCEVVRSGGRQPSHPKASLQWQTSRKKPTGIAIYDRRGFQAEPFP
jgi:hypothetical protein